MTSEMEEKHTGHFLKISGEIPNDKKKEFEQTIRFVFNQLPQECIQRELSFDANSEGKYSVFSLWLDEHSLLKFMESEEFLLIKGAYSALGHIYSIDRGISKDLHNTNSNHLN
jgi:hypothetical protein